VAVLGLAAAARAYSTGRSPTAPTPKVEATIRASQKPTVAALALAPLPTATLVPPTAVRPTAVPPTAVPPTPVPPTPTAIPEEGAIVVDGSQDFTSKPFALRGGADTVVWRASTTIRIGCILFGKLLDANGRSAGDFSKSTQEDGTYSASTELYGVRPGLGGARSTLTSSSVPSTD
jgi:hypothetical protein